MTRDEAGNTYFSTVNYPAVHGVTGDGAAPCVVRMRPDATFDAEWQPPLTEWTGGRHVKNFRYMGSGKALATVLHYEEFPPGTNFSALDYDTFWTTEGNNHHLWVFDLNAGAAQRVPGIQPADDTNAYVSTMNVGGRSFVGAGDTIYEFDVQRGVLEERFPAPLGGVTDWVQVR